MASIRIIKSRMNAHTVQFNLEMDRTLKPFFDEYRITFDYSSPISSVPNGILTIPVVANLAQLAWVTDSRLEVPKLDRTFHESLQSVKAGYRKMFEDAGVELSLGGGVVAQKLTDYNARKQGNTAMLFSGGADSMATYLRRQSESPALITIREAESDERWNYIRSNVEQFANVMETDTHMIDTNLGSVLNHSTLDRKYSLKLGVSWFVGMQYALGYMGLCAPLTMAVGFDKLYQASGYTRDDSVPGSRSDIVDPIRWCGTDCTLDAPRMSRQEKMSLIADGLDPGIGIKILSCDESESGQNCCGCKKCFRNVVGLYAAGTDPAEYGYQIPAVMLDELRTGVTSGELTVTDVEAEFWTEIQEESSRAEFVGDDAFARWFYDVNFEEFVSEGPSLKRRIWALLPYPIDTLAHDAHSKFSGLRFE